LDAGIKKIEENGHTIIDRVLANESVPKQTTDINPVPEPDIDPQVNPEIWHLVSVVKSYGIHCRTDAMDAKFGVIQREIITTKDGVAVATTFIPRAKTTLLMDPVTHKNRIQYIVGM
jgi:hypothetical protein